MKPWPLAISPFTVVDRLKIGWWLLQGHQWTAGPAVRAYEKCWEDYTGSPHAIMVGNGSVANELIARHRRDELIRLGLWPKHNLVIFPVCNWISSVSPWLMLGFEPVWADISTNLCASTDEIAKLLEGSRWIMTVFYTTLLGQATDLGGLRSICTQRGAKLLLDNCESSFSWTEKWAQRVHFCNVATSSTSFYFSHPATTGTEGGMIFCENEKEANWYQMMRNHGLTRGMPTAYRNPDAHPAFDFNLHGTNARSSDLQAYMGSLTFERSLAFAEKRIRLATVFYAALDKNRYDDPIQGRCRYPMMALPIVPLGSARWVTGALVKTLDRLGVEHRPVVGGNLLRHTAFRGLGDAKAFPRAEHVHEHGVYVGLHSGIDHDMVLELADELNRA